MSATRTYTVTQYPATSESTTAWPCAARSLLDAVRQFRAAKSAAPKGDARFPPAMRCFVRVDGGKRAYDVDGFGR